MIIQRKNFLLDFCFPKFCLGCYKNCNSYLCFSCFKKITYTGQIINSLLLYVKESIIIADSSDPILNKLIRAYYFQGIKEISIILAELFRVFWQGRNFSKPRNYQLFAFPESRQDISRRGYSANQEIVRLIATHFNYPLLNAEAKEEGLKTSLIVFSIFQIPKKKLMKELLKLPGHKEVYLVFLVAREASQNFTNYL